MIRFFVACAAIALVLTGTPFVRAKAAEPEADAGYELVRGLMSDSRKERKKAAEALISRGDPALAAGIVDAVFFIPALERKEAYKTLEALLGENAGDSYWDWVELIGRRTDLEPASGYYDWKVSLLSRLDRRYPTIFYDGAPVRIRLEEVVNGGVPLDGIPSIDDPRMTPGAEASYLKDREDVFGVDLGGEQRAYPLRFLDWHEMLNDEVGGEPITLSYCTLCGSGVLYSTRTPNGSTYRFGTSGLLYRSNKLMYDRQSYSLWGNLTGEPVIGRLARGTIRLEILPLTRTTWGEWRRRHPETLVMAMDPSLKWHPAVDYRPGQADAQRRGVSFPVWLRSDALEQDAEIYALRLGDAVQAYPLEVVLAEGVVNDRLGGAGVVLVADAQSGAVRAYRRGDAKLRRGAEPDQLLDDKGRLWHLTESSLKSRDDALASLPRLPGHVAFWFGWYSFFPHTEIYEGDREDG